MARKESITKDQLLEVAFELVKDEGIENLTARKLASKAGCSTQPIFRIYKNREGLLLLYSHLRIITLPFLQLLFRCSSRKPCILYVPL